MVDGIKEQKERKLISKERLFVAEYLKDLNATQEAIRAGYSKKTAYIIGHENLRKPKIQKALSEARNSIEKRERRALLQAREVEEYLDELITFNVKDYVDAQGRPKDLHELTDEQARCVKELGTLDTQIGVHRTIKFFDKLQAIDKKMRRLGMFKEVVKVENSYTDFLVKIQEHKRARLAGRNNPAGKQASTNNSDGIT